MSGARARSVGVGAGLAALVVLRLVLVHASMSEILNWEEPYRLIIATELLEGPQWALADYQADAYQGGSLAMGVLAVPFVAALGPSYETLKLAPLTFTVLTALAWAVLLWRWVSPTAAVVAVWLAALAPPMAEIYQVHAMGSHAESALFTVAGFALVMPLFRRDAVPGGGRLVALGAVAGAGFWYCYTAATGIAAWGLLWLARTPARTVRRALPALLAGAALGLAPWLAYNLQHDFHGVDRVVELFGRGAELAPAREPLAERAAALVGVDLVRALGFAETVPGLPEWPAWTWYALAGLVLVALAVATLRDRPWAADASAPALVAALVLLAIGVHLAVYLASSFRCDVENGFIAYRFFAPLFPLVAAGVGVASARARGRLGRAAAIAIVVAFLALGGLGTAELLRERPGRPLPVLAQADSLMGQATLLKHRDDPARGLALVAALREPRRGRVYFGFGWGLEFRYEKDGDWRRLTDALAAADPEQRRAVLAGIRWAVRTREAQVRRFANAGFLATHSRALHARLVDLAVRLRTLDDAAGAARAAG